VLHDEVIKRDVQEGAEAEQACRRVNRHEGRSLRTAKSTPVVDSETTVRLVEVQSSDTAL